MGSAIDLSEDVLDAGADKAPAGVSDPLKSKPAQTESLGPLLDEANEKKVADAIVQMLRDEVPNRKRRRAEWECNKLWLRGVRGARVRRSKEDYNQVELVVPLGAFDLPPVMDRTDELCEKVTAHLYSDPAVPEAEPATDSDADRDSAEFTTRLLTVEGSESGYNNGMVHRKASRKSCVYGSGFIYTCIDPMGGGWRPMSLRALEGATSTEDATIDPATQAPVGADDPRLVERHVRPDGMLTANPQEAEKQWLPKLKKEVLTGEQVVLLPNTCSGIGDADGAIIIRWTPLGKLKRLYPEKLGNLEDNSVLQALVDWRPEDVKHSKPGFLSMREIRQSTGSGDAVKDSALVCTLSLYYQSHGQYPKGAYITICSDLVLHKQPWCGAVEQAESMGEECLLVPLAQVRQFDDTVDDDPYGYGIVKKLGPADEVRGDIVLAWQEYMDKFLHPIPYVPLGSIVQPNQLQNRDDSPVFFNPQGKPEYEDVKPFPPDAKEFFDRATSAQDSATMLEEAAQGVDTSTAASGIAKQIVVQQAHVNMATMRNNAADAQERDWRITAQQIRVFYTVPMKLKYQGEDGSYKEREWSRSDLGSTKDIRIARGSFTQMSPEQKQANLDARYAQQLIDPEEYDRLSASNIRATVGYQDNPHRMRVRKQISAWRELVQDPSWQPPQPQPQPDPMNPGQPAIDPASGQPVMVAPPDPMNPFADVRMVDEEQDVARIRWLDLRKEQSSSVYEKADPVRRSYLDQAYQMARQAAGIATIAEQQMAQQQQMNAQAQQADKDKAAEASENDATRQANASEADAERQFQAQQTETKGRQQLEAQALKAQGAPIQ